MSKLRNKNHVRSLENREMSVETDVTIVGADGNSSSGRVVGDGGSAVFVSPRTEKETDGNEAVDSKISLAELKLISTAFLKLKVSNKHLKKTLIKNEQCLNFYKSKLEDLRQATLRKNRKIASLKQKLQNHDRLIVIHDKNDFVFHRNLKKMNLVAATAGSRTTTTTSSSSSSSPQDAASILNAKVNLRKRIVTAFNDIMFKHSDETADGCVPVVDKVLLNKHLSKQQ